jgi:hypothetical protein
VEVLEGLKHLIKAVRRLMQVNVVYYYLKQKNPGRFFFPYKSENFLIFFVTLILSNHEEHPD